MPARGRGGGECARAARRRLHAVLGLVLCACAAPPPEDPLPVSLYLQARVARAAGELHRCARLLEEAARTAPDAAPIAAALGEARLALGEDRAARIALERAVALAPDDVPSHVLLARLDVRERRPGDALARLLALDERVPAREEVLEFAHPLLLWSGATELGLEVFTRALELAPDLALVHEARADFLACAGRREEALAGYRRALALEPGRRAAELKAVRLLERQSEALLRRLAPSPDPRVGLPAAEEPAAESR